MDTDAKSKIALSTSATEGKRSSGRPRETWWGTASKEEERWGGIPGGLTGEQTM